MKQGTSVENSNLQNYKLVAEIKLHDGENQGKVENIMTWLLMQNRSVQGKPNKMPELCLASLVFRNKY
jgi:hypothetical protein